MSARNVDGANTLPNVVTVCDELTQEYALRLMDVYKHHSGVYEINRRDSDAQIMPGYGWRTSVPSGSSQTLAIVTSFDNIRFITT